MHGVRMRPLGGGADTDHREALRPFRGHEPSSPCTPATHCRLTQAYRSPAHRPVVETVLARQAVQPGTEAGTAEEGVTVVRAMPEAAAVPASARTQSRKAWTAGLVQAAAVVTM